MMVSSHRAEEKFKDIFVHKNVKKEIHMSETALKVANESAAAAAAAGESGASVDKIRDILFGSQIKNYEARFSRVEETMIREAADLKETMRRRFESLEGFFKSETEALAGRLKAEREERTRALNNLSVELKSSHETLIGKIAELEAATAEGHSGLRKELMSESGKLSDEVRERHDQLKGLIERRVEELRHQKTDRALLSALLTEIANQLSEDSGGDSARAL